MALRDDAALLILTSLAAGPKHGYAMIDDIHAISGVRVGPGTLYAAISRLETSALIEVMPSYDRRRPYRITSAGLKHLEAQIGSMRALVAVGMRRLREA